MVKSDSNGKRLVFALIFVIIIIFSTALPKEQPAYAYGTDSYVVMEASSRKVLKGYNENVSLPMASTTKIMTALIIIENCKMDEKVTIPAQAVGIEGSSIYLKAGEVLTVEELLYGLMLRSGNDASVALAVYLAGSVENFAEIMNIRAQDMGLSGTHFVNPNGLHDELHYTTAYELGLITCQAMKYPEFRKIVSTKFVAVSDGEGKRFFKNKNKMLDMYDGATGVKTGYTKKAGRCLVASAQRDSVTMISVVLNRGAMWEDCGELLDYGFENFSR